MSEGIGARPEPPRGAFAWRLVLSLAVLKLALHLVVLATTTFGIPHNKFLYIAMGRHLGLWRMDFPPLIAVLANALRALFDHTLAVVRVFPALERAALVILAALIARELGPGTRRGDIAITVGEDSAGVAKAYDDVRPVTHIRSEWSVDEERDVLVIVAREPMQSLQAPWPSLAGRN